MINTVRNTVLSVLNKNNYGYLSPSDFNLFAKQAQLDIFESYFYQYNYQINKENSRMSGTGIADIRKGIEEAIDTFSVTKGLNLNEENSYFLPSRFTTGDDYYLINKVLVYKEVLTEGESTSFDPALNKLIDANADFVTDLVQVGDIVALESGGVEYVKVLSVDSATEITTTGTHWDAAGLKYAIYEKGMQQNEAEKVSHSKITMLNNSLLTSPTFVYPAYTQENTTLDAFPDGINSVGRVIAQYYRYPEEPKWTYTSLTNGEPMYDSSQPDHQDFELPLEEEANLIRKILQYAGVSIREGEVYQFAQSEENEEKQGKA